MTEAATPSWSAPDSLSLAACRRCSCRHACSCCATPAPAASPARAIRGPRNVTWGPEILCIVSSCSEHSCAWGARDPEGGRALSSSRSAAARAATVTPGPGWHLSFCTAIDRHWLPFLRDLHSNIAVTAVIVCQNDSPALCWWRRRRRHPAPPGPPRPAGPRPRRAPPAPDARRSVRPFKYIHIYVFLRFRYAIKQTSKTLADCAGISIEAKVEARRACCSAEPAPPPSSRWSTRNQLLVCGRGRQDGSG
jgi:hypothetical protein